MSEAQLALLDLPVHAVLMELLGLSDQRVILVLSDPRVKLGRKVPLARRVILENVVRRVSVVRTVLPAPLALPAPLVSVVLLAPVWITSGPSR